MHHIGWLDTVVSSRALSGLGLRVHTHPHRSRGAVHRPHKPSPQSIGAYLVYHSHISVRLSLLPQSVYYQFVSHLMSTPLSDPPLEDEPSGPTTSQTTTTTVTTRSGSKKGKKKEKQDVQSQIEQLQQMVHDMAQQQAVYVARIAELETKEQVKKEEKKDDGIGLGLHDDVQGGDGDESDEDGGNDINDEVSYHLHDDKDRHIGMAKLKGKLVQHGHDDQDEPIVLPRIPKSLVPFKGESGDSVRNWLDQYDTSL